MKIGAFLAAITLAVDIFLIDIPDDTKYAVPEYAVQQIEEIKIDCSNTSLSELDRNLCIQQRIQEVLAKLAEESKEFNEDTKQLEDKIVKPRK